MDRLRRLSKKRQWQDVSEALRRTAIKDRVLKKDRDKLRQSISEKNEGLQSMFALGLLEEMRRQGKLTHEESKILKDDQTWFSSEPTDAS